MEGSLRNGRRRSGYEPSDTETDWHDSPNREDRDRQTPDDNVEFSRRRHSRSPYKPPRGGGGDDGNDFPLMHNNNSDMIRNISPLARRTYSDIHRNVSPFARPEMMGGFIDNNGGNALKFSQSERRKTGDGNRENASPFTMSERRRRLPSPYRASGESGHTSDYRQHLNFDLSNRSSYSRRAASAPRPRLRERGQQAKDRNLSPLPQDDRDASNRRLHSVGELNEMVANAKISSGGWNNNYNDNNNIPNFETSDSISPGDIFFSKDYGGFQKVVSPRNGSMGPTVLLPKPPGYVERTMGSHQLNRVNANSNRNRRAMSQTSNNSSSVMSRQSSNISDVSSRTTTSTRRFIENRQKTQKDAWFSCIKTGSCRTKHKSPEKGRPFDEAYFIERAIVVESLRPFWADKHQPTSLIGFTCHKQEALLLQQLASSAVLTHIILNGPPGSGKKALTMALLHEIYGDSVWNVSHELRNFHILDSRPMQVLIPVSSSRHHVELNVHSEPKAAYVLTAVVKQISSEFSAPPEISTATLKADYKVLVLYDVDKAAENIQHLIKWVMDCYSDSCKLILCCEDDVGILESVKDRCKIFKVEAPAAHEVIEVLIQIAKREGFDLSMSFAARIATKSKQNLRRAIMALEACKAHNYPFVEDQPIPVGWEEALVELAADILTDPLPKRLFIVRGKIQKLLADFVHPKLILLKLVQQFLHAVESGVRRELYYWYAYYDKRLPSGTSALLKLEGKRQERATPKAQSFFYMIGLQSLSSTHLLLP